MEETWAHRADLAETAINDRHAQAVWSIPRTNLAVVSWPPTSKEKLFVHWHYWWQAHYLDCLVDAALRNNTKVRRARIADTMRGIRLRNLSQLNKNRYYDDKAWLALAMGRAENLKKVKVHKRLGSLQRNIREGVDPTIGVLPWREGETFLNVPSNGPGAIMLARMGRINEARHIVDWIYDHLVDDDGLIMDGIRMRMDGPEIVKAIHPYCQGVVLGACLEIALALREKAGLSSLESIDTVQEAELAADMMHYITNIRGLVQAVATGMATPSGVINWKTGDGDGGLFKGILVRYLADVAVRLPGDSPANRATKKLAARMVVASAESVWEHRLEVDGLPIFGSDWTADARLPHNYGFGPNTLGEKVGIIRVAERDLSVQLSGWMLLEACARVTKYQSEEG
ncbi:glycoside hydrolase family 76 protein [Corynebacterium striatum]|uniref:Glycoside hydrolase family 76 n=1 Tax=Corynebacterium striatum TaxID=43770 RepID=A0ABC8CK27_CORST|nr:glycoside hydrolase family 76 protein [Corynebacterium striatum]ATZ08745.1 glycoside hydrolase family 76 [Corynebacterium striatum]EGT5611375.1 glycoside hydrolase family 76 [Corynebacterium striatum]MDK8787660.1 glycoside hydrolase family 76 protein [Corynebacterium striatum]HCT5225210.1 glycoside hydrolase family 76 [Corynebacterium striatum]HEI8410308.1 glycoside hydrolase family 76 [Corynebacterium striatum]